jgi:glutamate--cysteine ligase catalytic subunit
MGWRVEFRSMEVQPTDFENAAFSAFIVLLTRAILAFNINFYMPISKVGGNNAPLAFSKKFGLNLWQQVDVNMQRAQKRDAAQSERFFFRKNIFAPSSDGSISPSIASSSGASSPVDGAPRREKKMRNCYPSAPVPEGGVKRLPVEEEMEEMTMHEIINGKVR